MPVDLRIVCKHVWSALGFAHQLIMANCGYKLIKVMATISMP